MSSACREKVIVNKNGVNSKIIAHTLSDEEMRKIGFTDHMPTRWYYCREVEKDITFSVSIDKDNPEELRIDVLDECFCQPFDYQQILLNDPKNKYSLKVKNGVEKEMAKLKDTGVLSGHIRGEYI